MSNKIFAQLPWTMDMPEHLGGDEADVVLHIEGEYIHRVPWVP